MQKKVFIQYKAENVKKKLITLSATIVLI